MQPTSYVKVESSQDKMDVVHRWSRSRDEVLDYYRRNTGPGDSWDGDTLTRQRCDHGPWGGCQNVTEKVTFHKDDPRSP